MNGPTSYRLPNGNLIFPYDTGNTVIPPWVIVERKDARRRIIGMYAVTRDLVPVKGLQQYQTEVAARRALKAYAELHGLEPAF